MGKLGGISNRDGDIAGPNGYAGLRLFGRPWWRIGAIPILRFSLSLMEIFVDGLYIALSGLAPGWFGCDRSRSPRTQRLPTPQGAIPLLLPVETRRRQPPRLGGCRRF